MPCLRLLSDGRRSRCGFRVRVVVDGDQVDLRTNEYIIANRDAAASEEGTTLLDETSLPDRDRLTVVDVERRQYRCALFEGFAENPAHIFVYLFRSAVTCIHFCSGSDGGENVGDQRFVTWLIGRNYFTR